MKENCPPADSEGDAERLASDPDDVNERPASFHLIAHLIDSCI